MISDADIERRLRLHLTNLCLAVLAKNQEGALRESKDAVIREVARIVHDTRMEADAPRRRSTT